MSSILLDGGGIIFSAEDGRALAIADIHIGYHIVLSERTGAEVQSQHHKMADMIIGLINNHDITDVFILGDVKHALTYDLSYNWEHVPEFMDAIKDHATITVIPGNHDGNLESLLPRDVKLVDAHGMLIEGDELVGLIHGHAWPSNEVLQAGVIISGHGHPTIERMRTVLMPKSRGILKKRAVRVPVVIQSHLDKNCIRKKIDEQAVENDSAGVLINIPSFNPIVAGIAINRPDGELIGPIFSNRCANLDKSNVFSKNGVFLGSVQSLRQRYV